MAAARKKKKADATQDTDAAKLVSMIKGGGDKDASLMDVMQFAEVMANSLHSFFEVMDKSLFNEFRDIAGCIADMRQEIGKLQAKDLTSAHLPSAGEQLDAIVQSTEEATHTIMESAEAIMAADTSDHDAYVAAVNDQVMKIFEACSFQDLTGQRINKVVTTLQHIEERVSSFAEAIGAVDDAGFMTAGEKKRKKRDEQLILNGPQNKGIAIEQDTVDALLSGKK